MKARIQSLFNNASYKKLLKNSGILLGGDTAASCLGFFSFVLTARALGLENFGLLVLIDAYVHIVDKLVNFQSWQYMIKFGSDALAAKKDNDFKALVKFGLLIDICSAVAGCVVAVLCADGVGHWQGWDETTIGMAKIYSLVVIFNFIGVPTGILRVFDEFKQFAARSMIGALIKFISVFIACATHASLMGFLVIWMITEIIGYLIILQSSFQVLKKRGYAGIWHQPLKGITQRYPGIWKFLISTNLTGSVKVGFREIDVLIVGKMLGFADVALFKMAKRLASFLSRLNNPLYNALYPELAKLWAAKEIESFKKMGRHAGLLMGSVFGLAWVGFLIFGQQFLALTSGVQFVVAYPVTLWFMLAEVLAIATLPFSPMLLSMGKAELSLMIQFIPTVIYFPALYFLLLKWGLVGGGIAYVIFIIFRILLQIFFIKKCFRL
jgi:O-antigen/teichoic acid export membrane protein